jgi:hypothetical protein
METKRQNALREAVFTHRAGADGTAHITVGKHFALPSWIQFSIYGNRRNDSRPIYFNFISTLFQLGPFISTFNRRLCDQRRSNKHN